MFLFVILFQEIIKLLVTSLSFISYPSVSQDTMQLTAGLTSSESDISDSNEEAELISTTSSLPLMVLPLYSTLSPEEQAKVRDVNFTMKNETFCSQKFAPI